jgi:hypothetical protein
MSRTEFVDWLRTNVPVQRWESVWWQFSVFILLMLPIGVPVLYLIGFLGWNGVGRATQGLMMASVVGGVTIGPFVLFCVEQAGLRPIQVHRAKWLARLAIIGPFLELLIMLGLMARFG